MNTLTLNGRLHVIYRVSQAEYGVCIIVARSQEYVNTDSTRRPGTRVHSRRPTECAQNPPRLEPKYVNMYMYMYMYMYKYVYR